MIAKFWTWFETCSWQQASIAMLIFFLAVIALILGAGYLAGGYPKRNRRLTERQLHRRLARPQPDTRSSLEVFRNIMRGGK